MIYMKFNTDTKKIEGFYDTSVFHYDEDFSTTFIEITEKLRNKIMQESSHIELITIDIDKSKIYDVEDYELLFQPYIPDTSNIPKTPMQILEQENAELKSRVEVMQGALDALIMGGV